MARSLNQSDLLAHLVAEEISLGEMTTLLKLHRGSYSLVEEKVAPAAAAVGRRIEDLDIPERCSIVALIRADELIAGHGETRLEAGDEVLAVIHSDQLTRLANLLGQRPER